MRRTKKRDAARPVLAWIGWIGITSVLLGYALNSFSLVTTSHPAYFALNFVGAFALIVEARLHKDLPPLVLNIIWATIAVVGLVRFFIGW